MFVWDIKLYYVNKRRRKMLDLIRRKMFIPPSTRERDIWERVAEAKKISFAEMEPKDVMKLGGDDIYYYLLLKRLREVNDDAQRVRSARLRRDGTHGWINMYYEYVSHPEKAKPYTSESKALLKKRIRGQNKEMMYRYYTQEHIEQALELIGE